jgi:hypothetical protein
MKYKIGDKVIDTRTNRSLTIRDILTNPTGYLRVYSAEMVYYVYEHPGWYIEERLKPDTETIRNEKLKQLLNENI